MSSVNEDIGIRLRKIRGAHDLSQRALARRTGVSNAMISLIENGRSNPSIGMLRQILDGIPMSMAEFFALDIEDEQKVFFDSDELREIGSRTISYRQVGVDLHARKLQMLHERYAPGADTGNPGSGHIHQRSPPGCLGRASEGCGGHTGQGLEGRGDGHLAGRETSPDAAEWPILLLAHLLAALCHHHRPSRGTRCRARPGPSR